MEQTLFNSQLPSPKSNFQTILKTKKTSLIILAILFLVLIALQIVLIYKNKKTNSTDSSTTNIITPVINPYKINQTFAKYNLVNTSFKPSVPDSSISTTELSNLPNFETANNVAFTDSQKNALNTTNFFVSQNTDKFWTDDPEATVTRVDDWTQTYKNIGGGSIWSRAPENSVFISSDYLLHVYHRFLEKEFENIENKNLYPALREITNQVFAKAVTDYSSQTDADNKASYERIIAFFAVPKAILDSAFAEVSANTTTDQNLDTDANILKNLDDLKSTIPDSSYQKAKAELNLILAHNILAPSPLFNEFLTQKGIQNPQDYTQFTPRSHYTKNSALRSYFRAMMWFGRNNFIVSSPELTRDALNISLLMKATNELPNWEKIYIPTAFLVGQSDDLSLSDYLDNLNKSNLTTVDANVVTQIQAAMKDYRNPQIQSSALVGNNVFNTTKSELLLLTKGFRFMGQRFTPDAFIFSSLTQGDEKADPETNQKLPSSTTATMVMSILGNKTADPIVQNWISTNAPDSDKVLAKNINNLKTQFSQLSDNVWTQNIYWAWLYTLKSLNTADTSKTGYPGFVKNDDWNKKCLQASLGSWTELKHDTLLYAKQSYAEMGGGGDGQNPPVPKGYIEPNIPFFDRLIALVKFSQDGLNSRQLLNDDFSWRNQKLLESLTFYRDLAVKELQNEKISEDDFEKLRTDAANLNYVLSPLPGEDILEKNARSAIIADVHTDIVKSQILYEADGIPNYIYVAVKDQNGTRLTKGLVYNYYEFNNPLTQRLNDQDWQSINYTTDKSKLPSSPDWAKSLLK